MNFGDLDLNTVWFILLAVLLTGYAVLDGFDLGVGMLHLFVAKNDTDRRILLNAIGPVWDGIEVWLVTGGGALFAAFPLVYATVFSGFYLALMALLCALIFRAVSIEVRSKHDSPAWRKFWDVCFALGSFVAALLLGVAIGNVARGLPLDAHGEFAGTFLGLLNPYSLGIGLLAVVLFAMHGALYLVLKTEGELQARVERWSHPLAIAFTLLYAAMTLATLFHIPHLNAVFLENHNYLLVFFLGALAIGAIRVMIRRKKPLAAFIASSLGIVGLMAVFSLGAYPHLVYCPEFPERSLTIFNAASSRPTLSIMLTIALIGMPLVIAYTAGIYWVFRGKVKLTKTSY